VQLVARVVAVAAPVLADLEEQRGQPVEIAAHRQLHHLVLLGARDFGPVGRLAGELGVELGQELLAGRIHEEPGGAVQEVVAGGAVDRPRAAQPLARLQDLLDDDPRLRCVGAQPPEVGLRVPEAVGMIDSHTVERAVGEPPEDELVRVPEDVLVLDPQAHEVVDVEEAPIAEVARGGAPAHETEVLALEQRVERVCAGVHVGHDGVDRLGDAWLLGAEARERLVEHGLVPMAPLDARAIGRGRRR